MTPPAGPGLCRRCGRPTGRRRNALYCAGCRAALDAEQSRAAHLRSKALRSGRERAERIAAHDREWERRHTSRGLGFDAGARRTSPVPWEGDG